MDTNTKQRKTIAISMGDPAGIGPEIIVKALFLLLEERRAKSETLAQCAIHMKTSSSKFLLVGDRSVLEEACEITDTPKKILTDPDLEIIDLQNAAAKSFTQGAVSALCGKAAYEYIEKATSLCMEGKAHALVTAPINKESLRAGSVPFIGHTEIIAELTNTNDPLTLFEVKNLRVFFLSRHVSLRKACDLVKKERIVDYVVRCTKALKQLGIEEGTMAIAGLNPHSGENGLFGDEEVSEIIPAIKALQEMGYKVAGPIGADSVFHQALEGKYNSVLSLYHDQGHIATKTYDFERTISITCGMPILRSSVDHGTAFDIAGKGIASPVSMIEAIKVAEKYS